MKCKKVCVPNPKGRSCFGGDSVEADDEGLVRWLGKIDKDLKGKYCCFENCQIPHHFEMYKEDGSFWCKEQLVDL